MIVSKDDNRDEKPVVKSYLETEKYIVLSTERVILDRPDSDLCVSFSINDNDSARIRIKFSRNEKESGIKLEIHDDELYIVCYNFEEPLGQFTTKPIEIGEYKGKKLVIQIFSSLNRGENKARQVMYTLFLEK